MYAGLPSVFDLAQGDGVMPKIIRKTLYVHRDYVRKHVPHLCLDRALMAIPGDFPWTYVKWDKGSDVLLFVCCEDWDTAPEPVCGPMIKVWPSLFTETFPKRNNPYIIHGKHLFVEPDYTGFDWEEAKARWESYQGQPWLDKLRMGRKRWWDENAVPNLSSPRGGIGRRAGFKSPFFGV